MIDWKLSQTYKFEEQPVKFDVRGNGSPLVLVHGTIVLRTHIVEKRTFEKIIVVDPVALSPWGSPLFAHIKKHEVAFQGVPEYIHEAIVTAYVKSAMHHPMPEETLQGILKPYCCLENFFNLFVYKLDVIMLATRYSLLATLSSPFLNDATPTKL